MTRVPLARPAPPDGPRRAWPVSIAIFGDDAGPLADALIAAWPEARRVDLELRHAEGWTRTGDRLDAHPDVAEEALDALVAAWPEGVPAVGVGAAFAALVEPALVVFSGPLSRLVGLSSSLRAVARGAHLQLDEPRPGVMAALGAQLRRDGFSI